MLKRIYAKTAFLFDVQPPSGGCVLKPFFEQRFNHNSNPAAFRRLCVETSNTVSYVRETGQPPSGGCVLKHHL